MRRTRAKPCSECGGQIRRAPKFRFGEDLKVLGGLSGLVGMLLALLGTAFGWGTFFVVGWALLILGLVLTLTKDVWKCRSCGAIVERT